MHLMHSLLREPRGLGVSLFAQCLKARAGTKIGVLVGKRNSALRLIIEVFVGVLAMLVSINARPVAVNGSNGRLLRDSCSHYSYIDRNKRGYFAFSLLLIGIGDGGCGLENLGFGGKWALFVASMKSRQVEIVL